MKLNKYFMIGAMGLSLVACSDNLDDNQGVNGNASNEGTTYAAFTVDFKGTASRATTEDGTSEEQAVKTAYVVLVGTNGNIETVLEKTTDAKESTDTGEGVYTVDSKERYLFQTEPGDRTFYAIVNPDEAPTTGTNINTYFTTATAMSVEGDKAIADPESENGFMMTCQKAEIFHVEDGVTQAQALATTDAQNNFEIAVERVAAKVTVTAANATIASEDGGNAGGTIEGTIFNLRGGATMSTRMAQAAAEIGGNAWTYEKENVEVEVNATDAYKTATPAYCLENLHTTGNYKQDNVTYITLQTTFTPSKVVNATTGAIEDYTYKEGDNKTFYVVKEGALSGNYIMGDPTTGAAPSTLPAGVEALSDAYTNGECWFGPIWIGQEPQNDKDAGAPVVRNTWYNLEITKIVLPGSPDEPKPIPGEELEPETNVAITLMVMPWKFKNVQLELQ